MHRILLALCLIALTPTPATSGNALKDEFSLEHKIHVRSNGTREASFVLLNRARRAIEAVRLEGMAIPPSLSWTILVDPLPAGTKARRIPLPGSIGLCPECEDPSKARIAWIRFADGSELTLPR